MIGLLFLLVLALSAESFHPVNNFGKNFRLGALAPRRELFFEIIESGVLDRFPPGEDSPATRINQFVRFAKFEEPLPIANRGAIAHDPCEEFVAGLTAKPWWDKADMDMSTTKWIAELESQSSIIAQELKDVLASEIQTRERTFKGDSRYMQTMGSGWTAFRLQRLGIWNEENVEKFPKTSTIIRELEIPLAVRGVMFAKQAPGSAFRK